MKNKVLALVVALLMVLTLSACGGTKNENPNLIKIGDYEALHTGSYLTKDYDGNDTLVSQFTYTNNSKETASFMWSLFYTFTQAGQDLEVTTIFLSEDSFETLSDGLLKDVAPGASLDVALTYKLVNTTDPVEAKFSDLFESKTAKLNIDVASLKTKDASANEAETTTTTAAVEETTTAAAPANGAVNYKLVSFESGGSTMEGDLVEMMGGGYVVLNADGTGTIILFGESFAITYDDANMDMSGMKLPYTKTDSTLSFEMGGATYNLEVTTETPEVKEPGAAVPETTVPEDEGDEQDAAEGKGYAFNEAIAVNYAGDWHGMAQFYDCTGDYSDNDGVQCEIVARLIFDDNGYCTPYVRLCISNKDEDQNFAIDTMEYDEEYDCMLINGTLLGKKLDLNESFVELEDDTGAMYIGAEYDDGSGDVFKMLATLRHLDAEWDYENDDLSLPPDGVEFYKGKSFEEIVELYGYDTSLIPGAAADNKTDAEPETGDATETDNGEGNDAGSEATGIVTLQQLKDFKAWMDSVSTYETEYYKPTYEECVVTMGGIEPVEHKPDKWTDEVMFFKWVTADGKDNIVLTLKPSADGDGTWRYHAISWTGGVNG